MRHSFGRGDDGWYPAAGLIDVNGALYGTTVYGGAYGVGTVFSFNLKTGAEKVLHAFQDNDADGVHPNAGVIDVKGTLYGTTYSGGTEDCDGYSSGTVFSLSPQTRAEPGNTFSRPLSPRFPARRLHEMGTETYFPCHFVGNAGSKHGNFDCAKFDGAAGL